MAYHPNTAQYRRATQADYSLDPLELLGGVTYQKARDLYEKRKKEDPIQAKYKGNMPLVLYRDTPYQMSSGVDRALSKADKGTSLQPDDPVAAVRAALRR